MSTSTVQISEREKLNRLYDRLPPRQRRLLMQQAESYVVNVERLIAQLLPLNVEEIDGGYILSDNLIDMYGTGATIEEATADYKAALLDCYESLIETGGRLSDPLQKRLDTLKRILEPEEQGREGYPALLGN